MKQTLHTPILSSRDNEGSHFQISKLSQLGIFSLLFFLSSFFSYGQEYQWQWAKSGGGELGFSGDIYTSFRDEGIMDIAVDSNNNYYYLSRLNGNSPMYTDDSLPENIALEHYGGKDILLLSTDEEGNYRWHQVIGGQLSGDRAYNVVVDNNDGVYVNALLVTTAIEGDNNSYTHLSPEVTLPKIPENWDYTVAHSAFKTSFLLKYAQSDGSLLAYKAYQGEVNFANGNAGASSLWIDSEDHLHTYVSLKNGTHLDGLVSVNDVDENDFNDYRTYLIQMDTSLNIVGTPREFPAMNNSPQNHFFAYNEELNTYYIGGRNEGTQNFSYNNVEIQGNAFILAINADTLEEEWRREFDDLRSVRFSTVVIDDYSNIYLSGRYNYSNASEQRYFGDYAMPVNIGGESFAHVPFAIKLNSDGEVQWVRVPDSFTNQFSPEKQNDNESIAVINGEVVMVPRNPGSTWGDFEIVSSQDYNTVPAVVRLNADTGEVIGATHLEGYGAFTKVVGDQNGDIVLGGSFFGQMFSDNEEISTLQAISNRTDFFMTKLVLDTDSSTDNFLQANIKVYPNPTTDIVYFETEEQLQTYELYNMLGQRVKQGIFANSPQIDLSSFTSGTYFIKVITKAGDTGIFKVVKKY